MKIDLIKEERVDGFTKYAIYVDSEYVQHTSTHDLSEAERMYDFVKANGVSPITETLKSETI